MCVKLTPKVIAFKKPIFKGKVNCNDPNLFLDFEGKIDLSKRENSYDFKAVFDYVNLYQLHLSFLNYSKRVLIV
mgnify:CR=1 FL=1